MLKLSSWTIGACKTVGFITISGLIDGARCFYKKLMKLNERVNPNFQNSIPSKKFSIFDSSKERRPYVAILVPKIVTLTFGSSTLIIENISATYGHLALINAVLPAENKKKFKLKLQPRARFTF
jgi:hypothetical protein